MNEYANQYVAQALSQGVARSANQPGRLMAHELRTANRAGRRRRWSRR